MTNPQSPTACGHIALIGAPNAGKSTLMNRMVGAKISIVTPKAQTTRTRVTGVAMEGEAQLVFVDVPGVFDATQAFEKSMVSAAWNAARSADVILFIHDARKKPDEETENVLARIRDITGAEMTRGSEAGIVAPPLGGSQISHLGNLVGGNSPQSHIQNMRHSTPHQNPQEGFGSPPSGELLRQVSPAESKNQRQIPVLLALNKTDAVPDKKVLLERTVWFNERLVWQHIFMISARKGDGVQDLRECLAEMMPAGAHLYDRDALTDMPMRLCASELTREQCFLKLQEELPYTLTVENEKYETRADGSVEIHQNIIVQNERQKTILIGKGGAMLKAIGERARHEIGRLIGAKCHLYLFVKVRADWKDKPESYSYLGLEFGKR
jgi:GTPase Era involved in 16S rRNA processing